MFLFSLLAPLLPLCSFFSIAFLQKLKCIYHLLIVSRINEHRIFARFRTNIPLPCFTVSSSPQERPKDQAVAAFSTICTYFEDHFVNRRQEKTIPTDQANSYIGVSFARESRTDEMRAEAHARAIGSSANHE